VGLFCFSSGGPNQATKQPGICLLPDGANTELDELKQPRKPPRLAGILARLYQLDLSVAESTGYLSPRRQRPPMPKTRNQGF
jgi:hypothetical protein